MTDQKPPAGDKAKPDAGAYRSQIMWGYVTGAISLLCFFVGLEPTFIPLGFGVLGLVIAYQLNAKGLARHAGAAAALNAAGILLWFVFGLAGLRRMLGL